MSAAQHKIELRCRNVGDQNRTASRRHQLRQIRGWVSLSRRRNENDNREPKNLGGGRTKAEQNEQSQRSRTPGWTVDVRRNRPDSTPCRNPVCERTWGLLSKKKKGQGKGPDRRATKNKWQKRSTLRGLLRWKEKLKVQSSSCVGFGVLMTNN
jgi:hypothetical protein